MVKLLDYRADLGILEQQRNPFAAVVLAHVQTLATGQEAIAIGLEAKFGTEGLQLMAALDGVHDLDLLRSLPLAIISATSVEEVRRLVP